jgi:hypothetical protein
MNQKRRIVFFAVTALMAVVLPCVAQDQNNGQATPAVTGSGSPGHIAVWKSSTALTSSTIYATGGNVGIGTTTPAAKLEVNGDAQVDGNFSLSGSILLTGVGQLIVAPTDGTYNFGAGPRALSSTATGNSNTAVGTLALSIDSTGSSNTAIGNSALANNFSGGNNTAIGNETLGFNGPGMNNTAIGASALYSNQGNSDNNTAVGAGALAYNTTGTNNVAVGYYAGADVTTASNNIEIGNRGTATDSGTIRIGCTSTTNCLSGSPQTYTFIAGIYGTTTSLNSTMPVIIDANGNLGTIQSSRRYKEDINDMADSSDGLMQLRPVTFRYKKAYEDGTKPIQYGLIAEEVADVYPDLVARSADGQVESVRYQLLDPLLLNELQKQHATIAAQKDQIQSLEERLARIEAALAAGVSGAAGQ